MIKISDLKRHQCIWRPYSNGEISQFKVWEVKKDPVVGWWAQIDWADDDYFKIIHECDEVNYFYGEGAWDL